VSTMTATVMGTTMTVTAITNATDLQKVKKTDCRNLNFAKGSFPSSTYILHNPLPHRRRAKKPGASRR
jgi:hypothetical protein